MAVIGIQSAIWSNRFKTIVLILLFPILLFGIFLLVFFGINYFGDNNGNNAREFYTNAINGTLKTIEGEPITEIPTSIFPACESKNPDICVYKMYTLKTFDDVLIIFIFLGPVILIWCLISFIFHRSIIFSFTEAKPITRKEYPDLYNIIENLCISRGLPVPNIGILEDDSLNAFAVGWNPKKCSIVFSRGIINKLNKNEIEAVAAHELTHIINKDGLLMITIIVFIGAIAVIGEILFKSVRFSGNSKNSGNAKGLIILVGLILIVLGYLILPLVQLAISRKREYLADAGSVALTHDKLSMISSLQKISVDSRIESITKKSVSAICIADPFKGGKEGIFFDEKGNKLDKPIQTESNSIFSYFSEFFSTHPSIENRIEMLEKF
ncbi:M48 family metallopeptidase [Candidatus Gracilibacteria bacterium]|nr:M48 family metallopeptidase [Candidatus Gracilibacteria bacterium]